MKVRRRTSLAGVLVFLGMSHLGWSQDLETKKQELEALSRGLRQGQAIELKAMEIKAHIHEPTMIYILDRPRLNVELPPTDVFLGKRILAPIVNNQL